MVAVKGRCCLVSSCKISHLGIKPDSGGRPARERRANGTSAARIGALVHEVAKALMVITPLNFRVRNNEDVIVMYKTRERRARVGENLRIKTIQPRWATEE